MKLFHFLTAACLLVACSPSHPSLPEHALTCDALPALLPDYTEVTVPTNIAPLNFLIDETEVDDAILQISCHGQSLSYGGHDNRIIIDEEEWHSLLTSHPDDSIQCTLFTHWQDGWHQHPGFQIFISSDTLDRFVSYRLIEPSYVAYENIAIRQRDVTTFTETTILDNSTRRKEHCINCHSYQNYRTGNMLLHIRGEHGGTLLVKDGRSTMRTDLRRDGMMSNPVYPAWHPTLPFIAFSTNKTGQMFHLLDRDKIEVQDAGSALVLYDIHRDRMIAIPSDEEDFETFPTWSPDGKYIYYTSAHYEKQDSTLDMTRDVANNYKALHYNIFRRPFNADSVTIGPRELVFDAESIGRSATLPRISPDGRYLLFACGDFGYFHIWHSHADIWMLDLQDDTTDTLEAANSPRAESYPTWSSTGRWMLMASRRNDGDYSRIFFAHFDRNGTVAKAFELPQADPFYTRGLLKSYNRPEPMVEPAPRLQ